jgi:hypothetical protein
MNDPIVEEVRRWRMEHTRRFGGDLKRIYDDLIGIQHASGCKLVRRAPKLLAAGRESGPKAPVVRSE